MRAVSLQMEAPSRSQSTKGTCNVLGCKQITSDRKPYCIEHIDRLGYVKSVSIAISEKIQEMHYAKKHSKRIDVSGIASQEILEMLRYKGILNIKKLSSLVEIEFKALENYLAKLEKAGLVTISCIGTLRGGTRRIVSLKK